MSYLRYLCLFAYSGVQRISCCVVPVSLDCPISIAPLCVLLTFIYIVYAKK